MEIDHMPSRFLVATLEGPEIGVTERDNLLVQRQVAGPPQEIYSGRLDDTQAHERDDPADCSSKTDLTSVRMSNEMHALAGPPADCLDDFSLPLDREIGCGPAFRCATVAKQARRNDAELPVQRRNHATPSGPRAPRSGHKKNCGARSLLVIVDVAARILNQARVPPPLRGRNPIANNIGTQQDVTLLTLHQVAPYNAPISCFPNVRDGSIATEMGCPRYVRFSPDSYRRTDIAECLKGARNGSGHNLHVSHALQMAT